MLDAGRSCPISRQTRAAADCHDGDVSGSRGTCHSRWGLALERLLVERAFPCDYEPRPAQQVLEAHEVKQELDPRLHPRTEQCEGCEPDAACGARPRAGGVVAARGRRHDLRPLSQALFQLVRCGIDGTFLWSVDGHRPTGAQEWVADVTRKHDTGVFQRWVQTAQVECLKVGQCTAAWRQYATFAVAQTAPSALIIPAPPSLLALPPTARTISR